MACVIPEQVKSLRSTGDGERLWEHSMMQEYGRLTLSNGRVGAPVVNDDLTVVCGITSNCSPNTKQ
jgi:outer membrane protein assembly factor BamB